MYEDSGRRVLGQWDTAKGCCGVLSRCFLPLLAVHLGGERKDPELVGTCDRYLKGLLQAVSYVWIRQNRKKHSGGILTHRGKSLSVYYSGMGLMTGQGVTGVSVTTWGILGHQVRLYRGLCCHHWTQVEGIQWLARQVSEVVACKRGVTPPRTCLQNLADGVILLEKKRGGNTTSLPS